MNNSIIAQQRINNLYATQTGPEAQYKTIMIIYALSVVFGLVSIVGSAVGFNYDFMIFIPDFSIPTAIMLAVALEASRLAFIYGFFSFKEFFLKALFASGMMIMTVLAVVLHMRGMDSMATVQTNQAIKEVMTHNQKMDLMNQQRADKILAMTNATQSVVLNNGTFQDDQLMVKSMKENNSLISTLSSSKQITTVQAKYLESQRDQALVLQKVGNIVLPLVEIFALFGFLASFLKTRAVTTEVKDIVDVRNEVNAVRATALPQEPMGRQITKNYATNIKKALYKQLESDLSSQPNGSNSTLLLKDSQSMETPHTVDPRYGSNSTENLRKNINVEEGEDEETEEGAKEGAKSFKEQAKAKEEELFTIDLMKYPVGYNEVIKAMFDNGALKKNDFLVPKEEVVKKLGITRAYYETVTYDLKKNKHIVAITGKGYMALSDLKNEVKIA